MFVKFKPSQIKEKGDTIVEVLISIAVVSLILGGAYATTNRSLLATRDAEERGNAIKLVESQVERLKNLAKTNPTAIFGPGTPDPFCVNNSGGVVAAGDNGCEVNAAGNPTDIQPIYTLSVKRTGTNTFTVTNQWIDTRGRTSDKLEMIYRVYE